MFNKQMTLFFVQKKATILIANQSTVPVYKSIDQFKICINVNDIYQCLLVYQICSKNLSHHVHCPRKKEIVQF